MYESGLGYDSHDIENWAMNEEMTDWFAIQMPKIMQAYESIIGLHRIDLVSVDGKIKTIEYTDQELKEHAGILD